MLSKSPLPSLEALRSLALAGASDQLLGQAVRELLAAVPAETIFPVTPPSPLPGAPVGSAESPLSPDGRGQSISPGAHPSAAAALHSAPAASVSAKAPVAKEPAGDPVIVGFRASGQRSSVSFPLVKWQALIALQPDEQQLRALVRQVAATAPPDGNRSTWTFDEVMKRLKD